MDVFAGKKSFCRANVVFCVAMYVLCSCKDGLGLEITSLCDVFVCMHRQRNVPMAWNWMVAGLEWTFPLQRDLTHPPQESTWVVPPSKLSPHIFCLTCKRNNNYLKMNLILFEIQLITNLHYILLMLFALTYFNMGTENLIFTGNFFTWAICCVISNKPK